MATKYNINKRHGLIKLSKNMQKMWTREKKISNIYVQSKRWGKIFVQPFIKSEREREREIEMLSSRNDCQI